MYSENTDLTLGYKMREMERDKARGIERNIKKEAEASFFIVLVHRHLLVSNIFTLNYKNNLLTEVFSMITNAL
jgi:hypothetical protein